MNIIVLVVTVNGYAEDLRVDITPFQTRSSAMNGINVILKYSNDGDGILSIYKWYLPEHGLLDPIFELTRDGERVEYVGPLVKRRAPTTDDLISLTPGMTVRTIVQLSSVYNMTQSGNYVIQYKMKANQVLFSTKNALQHRMALTNDDQNSVIKSTPIVMFSVGHRNQLIERANETNKRQRLLTPTYTSCSNSRTKIIMAALNAAQTYTDSAMQYLIDEPSIKTRYTTWFGRYSYSNWSMMKSQFKKIQNVLTKKEISFDCQCPGGSSETYAYVYGYQHYEIYLCDMFWRSSTTGTDSQGGTLIHELAHFQVVANTDDHAYGHSEAKSLALGNPAMALSNSDNLQYFAENNPRLN